LTAFIVYERKKSALIVHQKLKKYRHHVAISKLYIEGLYAEALSTDGRLEGEKYQGS
jgi:hypothetical protein